MLLPASPIARTPTVVRDCENANLLAYDSIDERVTKAPHDETTLAETPHRAETRMLKQEVDGVFEFRAALVSDERTGRRVSELVA